jgi:4-amino-4-deoxy-L-arabinose transferase-like glycosyltransferase
MADGRRLTFHFLIILLACGLVYANSLSNGFHLDDAYRVLNNPGAQNLLPWWQHFVDPGTSAQLPRLVHYRPLLPLSLSINHALFGESLAAYHAVNLLLHAFSSLLVYLLSAELLRHWSGRNYPRWLPLAVALLFAVHPVGGVLVNYISGRDLLMMQLFATAALFGYLRLRRLGDTPLRWSGCLLLLLLALLAKTNAVVFPALVLAFEALFTRGPATRYLRALPFVAVVAAFLLYIHVVLDFSDAANAIPHDASHLQYFLHQLQHHVFHYLRNVIWPWPMRSASGRSRSVRCRCSRWSRCSCAGGDANRCWRSVCWPT